MRVLESWPFLSEKDAERLAAEGHKNTYTKKGTKSKKSIWVTNLFTYYNMLNLVLAILVATTKSYRNMFFMAIVIANFFIGTVQELRAKKALESLSVLSAPKTRVIRDGVIKETASEDLVLGDLVIFGAGDQIMADGTLFDGEIRVNESLITGESDPVVKLKNDTVKSGSFVISGEAAVKLTSVGKDSFAEKIAFEGRKQKSSGSVLKKTMEDIIKVISFFIVPMGIFSFVSHYFRQNLGYSESMISTVAAMVGMIPDGLYLLTSVSFAAGVIRLAKKRTLVQQLYSLESLARADVLCLDKTGTITTGKMKVCGIIDLEKEDTGKILSKIYSAVPVDNETAKAVVSKFGRSDDGVSAIDVLPFSSENKFVAADFGNDECYIFGAPEYVMNENFEKEQKMCDDLEKDGTRILALARAKRDKKIYKSYKMLSFIQIEDEIRENAGDTFKFFGENGVTLKVISGDSAKTVSAIAHRAGIPNALNYLDVSGLSDDEIESKVSSTTVFGRVTPEQKKTIIHALKKQGHKVAMTGDGVNDVLALKEADCSVAMANGAGAASHASQIVLIDSDFAAMPDVLFEGRRVINNIQRAAPLFLMKTMYSFGITIMAMLFGFGYPFEPVQLTFIGLIASAIPGLLMSFEPSFERVKGDFINGVIKRAAAGAATIFTGILVIHFAGIFLSFSGDEMSTMTVVFTGFSSLVTLILSCKPLNRFKGITVLLSAVIFIIGIVFMGNVFMLVPISVQEAVITTAVCLLSFLQYFIYIIYGRKPRSLQLLG